MRIKLNSYLNDDIYYWINNNIVNCLNYFNIQTIFNYYKLWFFNHKTIRKYYICA